MLPVLKIFFHDVNYEMYSQGLIIINPVSPFLSFRYSPYGYIGYDNILFPDANVDHNFCRNPREEREVPWCHIGEGEAEWEPCDVPLCGKLSRLEMKTCCGNSHVVICS